MRGQLAQGATKIPTEILDLEQKAISLDLAKDDQQALRIMEQVMTWVNTKLARNDPYRARILVQTAELMSSVGRTQESLAITQEAITVYRELVKTNPDEKDTLATALRSLSERYRDLGRLQEALTFAEESVKVHRELPYPYIQELPNTLNVLAALYSNLGRHQEALASADESVRINQGYISDNPLDLLNLAWSLNTQAFSYFLSGRKQEALAPAEEAVRIARDAAKIKPAQHVIELLSNTLDTLGQVYRALGRSQEALLVADESVILFKRLSEKDPRFIGFFGRHPREMLPYLAYSLTTRGVIRQQMGQLEQARNDYEESLKILRPLVASKPGFKDDLQRTLNNLEELNRKEGILTGEKQELATTDVSYLPQNDPITPVKRAVVRLLPTFSGKNVGIGQVGTGFVVRRQGDRAWIATALHVVRDLESNQLPTKMEAELFTGPLPAGRLPPRLEVMVSQGSPLPESGDEPILLEIRGIPPDILPLQLATSPAQGVLTVVGHPSNRGPWTVVTYPLLKITDQALLLDGGLDSGASGSPVLSASGQVVGVVYDSPEPSTNRPLPLVWVFPVKALASKMFR